MKHLRLARQLVIAAILLSSRQAFAQTSVAYRCRRPTTGSAAVRYRWYICRPDSNTLIFQTTTGDTFAAIVHQSEGERVRVVAVDALNRAGPRSCASLAWSSSTVPTGSPILIAMQLHPVFPNPFNSRTTVGFELPEAQHACMAIYALDGRLIRVLADAQLPAGRHALRWDGIDANGQAVASGTYVCRLMTPGKSLSVRMTLVR